MGSAPALVSCRGAAARLRIAVPIAALLSAAACGQPPPRPLAPVDTLVLVSIDSLRADHVGAYGYPRPATPAIDRLATSGTVFERAYSTTSWTLPAHVALLTGRDDFAHTVIDDGRKIPSALATLPEALRRAGIQTVGFFSAPYLHPSFGFQRGFDEYVNCTSMVLPQTEATPGPVEFVGSYRDVTNPILLRRFRDWLKHRDRGGWTFVFIHMWDPHYDYIPPPSYVRRFDPDYTGTLTAPFFGHVRRGIPARDLQYIIARYDAEIRYTDDTLGRILELLRRRGRRARSAVIVLADHGEEFLEHGKQGHRWNLYEEVLRIPLVIHVDGRAPAVGRVDDVVSIVDVFPTVCELLGVACRTDTPGRSLVPFVEAGWAPARRGDALAELTVAAKRIEQVALVRAADKVIRWVDTGVTTYFDRAAMGSEQSGITVNGDRPGAEDAAAREAVAQLERRAATARAVGEVVAAGEPATPPALDAATREHLKALGYVE